MLQTLLVFLNFQWHGQNKVGKIGVLVLWRDREKLYWQSQLMRKCPEQLWLSTPSVQFETQPLQSQLAEIIWQNKTNDLICSL